MSDNRSNRRPFGARVIDLGAAAFASAVVALSAAPAQAESVALGWTIVELIDGQPGCATAGWQSFQRYMKRNDCGFGWVAVSDTTDGDTVQVQFLDDAGTVLETQTTAWRAADTAWRFTLVPGASWPAGEITLRVSSVKGVAGNYGERTISLNHIGADISVVTSGGPGDPIDVEGRTYQYDQAPTSVVQHTETDVPAFFKLRAVDPGGTVTYMSPEMQAASDGSFGPVTIPGSASAGLTTSIAIQVVDAHHTDLITGEWAGAQSAATSVIFSEPEVASVKLHNSFVSAVGWVKPGESYPWRVFATNDTAADITGAVVTIPVPDGTTFTNVTPLTAGETAGIGGGSLITWTIGTLPAGATSTLVAEARAFDAVEDPQIVWKDLSNTATLNYLGGSVQSSTHGPKVIPPLPTYNTARFGDRPYVVVPADYTDRKHEAGHTGDLLEKKLNDPAIIGSTFNLWQEVSFGQLYPHGSIGSAGIASADFTVDWKDPNRTDNEFDFPMNTPQGTCAGSDLSALAGTAAYPERISNGWYQLPRDTNYYGGDRYGTALIGALGGVGLIFAIDDACGPTGKAVYDAAHIADPEIDYNEFDTDKDGVVDFFMLVFVGIGGNGASQLSVPPYDNIWPHSSSLEFYYSDPVTGLKGYVSDDQLKSFTEIPQCWVDTTYSASDDCFANGGTGDDSLPVYVRVGPYNVNPEDAIDQASVISHEYGHSLGLPDFYCTGSKSCYGDWNLMGTDKSHHMDVFGKQEMGWVVPKILDPGTTVTVTDWKESKFDTGEIEWRQPDGTPYTLSSSMGDQNIHNAEAYNVKLPSRLIIDPALVANGASLDHVWFSGAGNDFGCPGHTFDTGLSPQEVGPGDVVTIEFATWFDIEWDYDYGFTLVSSDLGNTYEGLPSNQGFTTPNVVNPNANACQSQFDNGLTGTSGSFLAGTQVADRATTAYPRATEFTTDSYTYTMPPGADQGLLVRFAYATDPGFAGAGWFIDDLRVLVNGEEVFSTDFESGTWDARFEADQWSYISASAGSQADRGYYMEMRDRTGFDFDGNGENNRGAIAFQPGMLLVITDESLGYGNTGSGDFPFQHPVDANPQPGNLTPALGDAAFTLGGVSHYDDNGPVGWIDNYADGSETDGNWHHRFNCLSFDVINMGGTDVGPAYPLPGNLFGDVSFDIAAAGPANCGEFQYWPASINDFDADGVLNEVDNCPDVSNALQEDVDTDGVGDACDNCTTIANADQCDTNLDQFGNVCDADLNDDGIVNSFDLSILRNDFGLAGNNASDLSCDGIVNSFDLSIMRGDFGGQPGPSAYHP